MILKLLLVGLVVYVVYSFFIKKKPLSNNEPTQHFNDKESNDMVECVKCSTYVDIEEAFLKGGKYYCSKECMDS